MGYEIKTHKGITFTIESGLNLVTFVDQLNNRSLVVISISDMVMNKNNIKVVHPTEQADMNAEHARQLHTSDGEVYWTEIEDYNADQLALKFNNPQIDFVLVGNVLVQKHNVDLIK